MAAKEEVSMTLITPRAKADFLKNCLQKQRELGKSQREYKKVLSKRLKTRSERIRDKSLTQAIDRLESERNNLRAQLWVGNGSTHKSQDQRHLEQIQCHLKCQDCLSEQIKKLKIDISNLEHQIGHTDKQIFQWNLKTVPDAQYEAYVMNARKKLSILENRLEVGVRRECKFTTMNSAMREELNILLEDREQFNHTYKTFVEKLNNDKKYLIDLLHYANNTFDGEIQVMEKISNVKHKGNKDSEQAKLGIQSVMRKYTAAELMNEFLSCKSKSRTLADLQPIENRRRKTFKRNHVHKINLYNNVLATILEYTKTHSVGAVIENFQQHEVLYYTYFSYANETSFHITLLETAVQRLCKNLKEIKIQNNERLSDLNAKIDELQSTLKERKKRNKLLDHELSVKQQNFEYLLLGIAKIFHLCRADEKPLLEMLGAQGRVDLFNLREHLKLMEKRILDILRCVYIMERQDPDTVNNVQVVRNLERYCEEPTDLNEIVLTQQCPECAESATFNIGDGGDVDIAVTSFAETIAKLSEMVNQPDMQYRLHSISQCRLPRSRYLEAKRN